MERRLLWIVLGIAIGAVCGAVSFASVTVLALAAQEYGASSLSTHVMLGAVAGGLLGPAVTHPRVTPLRAALLAATALCTVYVGYCFWLLSSEPMMLPPSPVIRWAMKSLALIGIAAATTGASAALARRALAAAVDGRKGSRAGARPARGPAGQVR